MGPIVLSFFTLISGGASLVLKDGVGKLPALGWNSWNAFGCDITEGHFITAANTLVSSGLKNAGYEYVNIDDCWSMKDGRDQKTNRLIPNATRFPDGIKGTADKIHQMGLKIGIYSSAGTQTCAGWPASLGYEKIDAETWAEWGIDYIKYDNCYVPKDREDGCIACIPENRGDLVNGTCTDTKNICPQDYDWYNSRTAGRFRIMRDAVLAQDRTMLYSLCEWGNAGVNHWGNVTGSSWRMSGDINEKWPRILEIFNMNSFYMNYVDFWGHPDADMLEVGNGINVQEARTHFAFWAAMKSPLLIGCDMAKITKDSINILSNKHLLAFNQDPNFGKPAMPYKWGTNPDWTFNASFPAEYWSGQSSQGILVLMFNPYDDTRNKTAKWSEIPEFKRVRSGVHPSAISNEVIDIWTGQSLGCYKGEIEVPVERHDTAALLITGRCQDFVSIPDREGQKFVG